MRTAADADPAVRRARVVEALADAVATFDRAPPVHVGLDGLHDGAAGALAARHGRRPRDDDLLAPDLLRRLLDRTGWWPARHDDAPDRFLAVAERRVTTLGRLLS